MQLTINELKIHDKIYILWCSCWYEAVIKQIKPSKDNILYVFKTHLGDIHLFYKPIQQKWDWETPFFFNDRFEAILFVGIQIFKGKIIRRTPYSQEKHINLCLKYVPEKLI